MKIAVVALTRGGSRLGQQLWRKFKETAKEEGWEAELFVPQKFAAEMSEEGETIRFFAFPLRELMSFLFADFQGLILIMAAGIAVRMLAPLIKGKKNDPAVVVMDEEGRFAVSLLGGHLAGANRLAQKAAFFSGGQAVITTATDVRNALAIELLARHWDMRCVPEENWKKINAAFANKEKVCFYLDKNVPAGLVSFLRERQNSQNISLCLLEETGAAASEQKNFKKWNSFNLKRELEKKGAAGAVLITSRMFRTSVPEDLAYVFLRPRCLAAGVGCKRGTAAGEILAAVERALALGGLAKESLRVLASITNKRKEKGLLEAARQLDAEAIFFSPEDLSSAAGFEESERVKKAVGVGAVCEPAAWLAAGRPQKLLVPKVILGAVTVAIAEERFI